MVRKAASAWCTLLMMGATALLGAVLFLAAPASAAPTTGSTGYGPVTAGSTIPATPVAPAPKTSPSAIAFTGAEIEGMVAVGVIAIGVGGTLVLVSRRRRRTQPA